MESHGRCAAGQSLKLELDTTSAQRIELRGCGCETRSKSCETGFVAGWEGQPDDAYSSRDVMCLCKRCAGSPADPAMRTDASRFFRSREDAREARRRPAGPKCWVDPIGHRWRTHL